MMYRQIAFSDILSTCHTSLLDLPITWNIIYHPRAKKCFQNPPATINEIMNRLSALGNIIIVGSYVQSMLSTHHSGHPPQDIDIQLQVDTLPTDSKVIGTLFQVDLAEPPSLPVGMGGWEKFKTASSLVSSPLKLASLRDLETSTIFGFTMILNGSIDHPNGIQSISIDIGVIDISKKAPIFDFYHHSIGWSHHSKEFEPIIPQHSSEERLSWINRAITLEKTKTLESAEGSGRLIRSFWMRFSKGMAIGYTAPLSEWIKAIESIQSTYLHGRLSESAIHQRIAKLPPYSHHSYCLVIRLLGIWANIPHLPCPIDISADEIMFYGQSLIHKEIHHPAFNDVVSLKKLIKDHPALWTPLVWDWMKINWKMIAPQDWVIHCWAQKIPSNWQTYTPENLPFFDSLAIHAFKNPAIQQYLIDSIPPNRIYKKCKYWTSMPHLAAWVRDYLNKQALTKEVKENPIDELDRNLRSDQFMVEVTLLYKIGIANLPMATVRALFSKLNQHLLSFKKSYRNQFDHIKIPIAVYAMLLDDEYSVNHHKLELSKLAGSISQMNAHHPPLHDLLRMIRDACTDTAWVQFLLLPLDGIDLYTHFSCELNAATFSQHPFISINMLPILEKELESRQRSSLSYLIKTHRIVDVSLFCSAIGSDYAERGFMIAISKGSFYFSSTFLKKSSYQFKNKIEQTQSTLGIRYQLKKMIAHNISCEELPSSGSFVYVSQALTMFHQLVSDCFNNIQQLNRRHLFNILTELPELMVIPLRTRYGRVCFLDCVDTFQKAYDNSETPLIDWVSDLLSQNSGVVRDVIHGKTSGLAGIVYTLIMNQNDQYCTNMLDLLNDCIGDQHNQFSLSLINTRNISLLFKKTGLLKHRLIASSQFHWTLIESKFKSCQSKEGLDAIAIPIQMSGLSNSLIRKVVMGRYSIYYNLCCINGSVENIKRLIQHGIDHPISLYICHSQLSKVLVSRMIYKAIHTIKLDPFHHIVLPQLNSILSRDIQCDLSVPITDQLCKYIDEIVSIFESVGIQEPYASVDWQHLFESPSDSHVFTETIVITDTSGSVTLSVLFIDQQIQSILISKIPIDK